MKSTKNKTEYLFGLPLPVGVEIIIVKKQPARGYFCEPMVALKMGYKKEPTIILDYSSGRLKSILAHEIGHFLHWQETNFIGLEQQFYEKERQADIYAKKWYKENVGNIRGIRFLNLPPKEKEKIKKL